MPGPISDVQTITEGISLDIDRILRWEGNGPLNLEFIVPDRSTLTGWKVLLAITEAFNRIADDEETRNDGSDVIFQVADINNVIGPIIGTSGLCIRVDGVIYTISKVPPVASNEAQVYTIYCKVRTIRTNFDNTR